MRDFILLNELSFNDDGKVISIPMYVNISQIITFGKPPNYGPDGTNCVLVTRIGHINVAETVAGIYDMIHAK